MKRKILIIALCLTILTFSTGLIYGMTSVSVTNEFETGIVDIRLKEYQTDGTKETPWEDNPTVLPGDTVSKIPRIFNDGVDCYVRAKFAIKNMPDLDVENIFGITDRWILADDGYYYYDQILKTGQTADLFKGIEIPIDFPQTNEEKTFQIEIDVEAIQAKNFEPDYKKAAPWGPVTVLKNENTGDYNITELKQSDNKSFQIVYQGTASSLVRNEKDFFANIPYLMPGDSFSDSAVFRNTGDTPIIIHFRSQATDKSVLLDKIILKITSVIGDTTKVVYEGPLRAESLSEDIVLGTIPPNSTAEFKYEISVPETINNQYTLNASEVIWIFSTEETKTVDTPDTGDDFNLNGYLLMMVSSAAMSIILLVLLKKEKKEEKLHA